jgi:branched-subunit amino acid transport protein
MHSNILVIICGAGIVTFLIRYLPLTILQKKKLPWWGERLLYYLPLSILGALAIQSVFLRAGRLSSGLSDFYLFGAVTSIFLGIKTKNLTIIIVGGIGTVALCIFLSRMLR